MTILPNIGLISYPLTPQKLNPSPRPSIDIPGNVNIRNWPPSSVSQSLFKYNKIVNCLDVFISSLFGNASLCLLYPSPLPMKKELLKNKTIKTIQTIKTIYDNIITRIYCKLYIIIIILKT